MTRYQTAGIVCYSMINDELHFLLGREQYVSGWSCSNQWSEPGGHSKKVDLKKTSNTAIREFTEETLNVLPNVPDCINNQQFTSCLNLCIKNRRRRGKAYYLLHLPTCHDVRTEFHIRREQLKGIQYTIHRLQNIQRELISRGAPCPEKPRRVDDRLQIIQDIIGFQEMSDQTCRVKVHAVCPVEKVYFRFIRENEAYESTVTTFDVPASLAAVYIRLLSLKQLLIKELEALPEYLYKNAILMPKICSWLPRVRREYLEKDRLQWIPAMDIVNRIGQSWLRPGFEIAVQLMIKELAKKTDLSMEKDADSGCSISKPEEAADIIDPFST